MKPREATRKTYRKDTTSLYENQVILVPLADYYQVTPEASLLEWRIIKRSHLYPDWDHSRKIYRVQNPNSCHLTNYITASISQKNALSQKKCQPHRALRSLKNTAASILKVILQTPTQSLKSICQTHEILWSKSCILVEESDQAIDNNSQQSHLLGLIWKRITHASTTNMANVNTPGTVYYTSRRLTEITR